MRKEVKLFIGLIVSLVICLTVTFSFAQYQSPQILIDPNPVDVWCGFGNPSQGSWGYPGYQSYDSYNPFGRVGFSGYNLPFQNTWNSPWGNTSWNNTWSNPFVNPSINPWNNSWNNPWNNPWSNPWSNPWDNSYNPYSPYNPYQPQYTDADVSLDQDDDGDLVELEVGETLSITLPSNASTGFAWELDTDLLDTDVIEKESSQLFSGYGGLVGRNSSEQWIFEAVDLGTTIIRLDYQRSWEDEAIDTIEFDISVE